MLVDEIAPRSKASKRRPIGSTCYTNIIAEDVETLPTFITF